MKSLAKIIEFLPVIAFFISYRLTSDMVIATAIIVASCVIATALEYLITHTISKMQIFLTIAVVLFGVPTVLLNNPEIIKWKVTVVNLILSGAIFVSQYLLHKNPFAYLLGKEVSLPDKAWNTLSTLFMYFFIFAAGLNLVIAFALPSLIGISYQEAESWWVDYKTFGNSILNFVFAILCLLWVFKKYPDLIKEVNSKEDNKA